MLLVPKPKPKPEEEEKRDKDEGLPMAVDNKHQVSKINFSSFD